MSYDIFAFAPEAVGADDDVLAWYQEQATWWESHPYDDPTVTTLRLQAFYRDLITVFPPMNGPDAPADDDDADTDYTFGPNVVDVAFRWAKADHAREVFIRMGQAHGVGVCEISESPAIVHRPIGAATAQAAPGAPSAGVSTGTVPGAVAGREAATEVKPALGDTDERIEGRFYS